MALLTASEKLKILVSGKATLKELNDLEKQAETEAKDDPKDDPKDAPKDDPKDDPKDEPTEKEKELLEKIKDLESKLSEAQQDNVNGNSGGSEPSFDEQLDSMFKNYRF